MATAAVCAAMSCEETKDDVHPFFLKGKRIGAPLENEPESILEPQDVRPVATPEGRKDSDEQDGAKRKTPKRDKGLVEVEKRKQMSLHAFTSNQQMAPGQENVFTTTLNGHPTSNALFEEDLNYGRRKRRKTASPEAEPRGSADTELAKPVTKGSKPEAELSWREQLLVEAHRAEMSASAAESPMEKEEYQSTGQPPPAAVSPNLDTGHTQVLKVSEPSKLSVSDLEQRASPDFASHTPPPLDPKPKRMIRLKGGKLASPTLKKAPEQPQLEEKLKPRRRTKQSEKKLIVIIKYPGTFAERVTFGGKITRILKGNEKVETGDKQPKPSPKKPSAPPKITHPFFLGKAVAKTSAECDTTRNNPPNAVQQSAPSPRKSAVTPGKIRAQVQAHRASLSFPAFGQTLNGPSQPRLTKHPGLCDAPWPWGGVTHLRGGTEDLQPVQRSSEHPLLQGTQRKRKDNAVVVHESEDIVQQYSNALHKVNKCSTLRLPQRLVTSGPEIQRMVSKQLRARLNSKTNTDSDSEGPVAPVQSARHLCAPHPALSVMYSAITENLTPFDRGECEIQAWNQKYAPKCAAEVLQVGKEALILKDWLQNSTISAVDKGSNQSTTGSHFTSTKAGKPNPEKKRKRKKADDLDDFVVTSDDDLAETGELEELQDEDTFNPRDPKVRSLVRNGGRPSRVAVKPGGAVLLSGAHGCGKTATVYAVAKELSFEVFELNSGSRRSGKDVLDKIGDMTENHLVQQVSKALSENKVPDESKPTPAQIDTDSTPDIKQGNMTSFFKPTAQIKKVDATKSTDHIPAKPKESKPRQKQQQKQSLILLEEVDVLFEEDKQFWLTVLTLALHSKRPIVLTCNDENLVPLEALCLHAILRLVPPPLDLSVDYLLLLAAREGHLLKRSAVQSLYHSRQNDLRASISDLDFWCQIGVGDSTGGFQWMIDRWPPGTDVDEHGNTLRIASKDSYIGGMGLLPRDLLVSQRLLGHNKEEALLLDAWEEWQLEPDEGSRVISAHSSKVYSPGQPQPDSERLKLLSEFDMLLDCASAADAYSRFDTHTTRKQHVDATLPLLAEKARANYTVGWPLLHADPPPDFAKVEQSLAISALLQTNRMETSIAKYAQEQSSSLSDEQMESRLLDAILQHQSPKHVNAGLSRNNFSQAFDPIAEAPTSTLSGQTLALTASSFDREFSIIVTDIAPYVRSIAAYDLRLEEQRLKLSNLLSAGGRNTKKLRMTRASRSALEGGKRENTRRERWFDKNFNLALVMETAGKEWAGLGSKGLQVADDECSVRSEAESVTSSQA